MTKGRIVTAIALLAASAGLYGFARYRAPEVYIECVPGPGAVQCSLDHRSGVAAHACWDFVSTCANGKSISARACDDVQPGAKISHAILSDQLQGMSGCDQVVSNSVRNAVVEAL